MGQSVSLIKDRLNLRDRSEERRDDNKVVDREGAVLHDDFQDCLADHKYHLIYATWAVVVPWSYFRKTIGPFVIGTLLAVGPDMFHANWRCDDKYKAFQRHCDTVKLRLEQRRQQQRPPPGDAAGTVGRA